MNKLKVLSLFSGVGQFDAGLEATGGFETVAFVEIDKDCQKVLKKNWPEVPVLSDIKQVTYLDEDLSLDEWPHDSIYPVNSVYGKIDVICGGFPCQDISVAGKQKGLVDEEGKETRSGLWSQYKRIIKEVRPRYVLIENVANLRNKGLVTVLQDLHELLYDVEGHCISARSIGACHLRNRLWIIAWRRDVADPNSNPLSLEPGRSSRQDRENPIFPGNNGQDELSTNSDQSRLEKQCKQIGVSKEQSSAECSSSISSNTNNLRFWRPFTSEKEKSEWWTSRTSSFRSVFRKVAEIEPTVCRGNDGNFDQPYTDKRREGIRKRIKQAIRRLEQLRKSRIKQCGNALVPQIAQFIGERILEYERSKK